MIEIHAITDVEELLRWRKEVILNVFGVIASEELLNANREYYRSHIANGTHLAFVSSFNGNETGTGAICLSDELPSPDNLSGKCAYLMNIYVRKEYRRLGIAAAIVNKLIEEAGRLGCGKIFLESTQLAKPLYAKCHFINMENMMKYES